MNKYTLTIGVQIKFDVTEEDIPNPIEFEALDFIKDNISSKYNTQIDEVTWTLINKKHE